MYELRKNSFFLFFVPLILFFLTCNQQSEIDDSIIARAGSRMIDWKLLQRSYELNPQWKKDLTYKQAYLRQLDYLINEKLFAQAAVKNGLLQDSLLRGYLKFIQEKELVKELYRQEVVSQVEISEQEYQEAYQKLKRRIKFEYIQTSSAERAEKYASELKLKGVKEILLLEPEIDLKGISPLMAFGELRLELEEKVFNLQAGEIAGPIPIDNGFMVVKLVDGQVDLFMSELDFAEKKNKIQKVIFDRKASVISNTYIKELMADKNLTLNPEVFYALSQEFSRIIKNKFSAEPIPIYISDEELAQSRNDLSGLLPQTLITFRDGQMTVGEFLKELSYMPPDLRPNLKMIPQLKDAIGVIIRNKYLARKARQRGLDKNKQVKWETQVQSDEILARYWLWKKSELLTITPEEVLAFKQNENFQKYQKMNNSEPSDEVIRNLLFKQKNARQKLLLADSLKITYDVKVDSSRLTSHLKNAEEIIQYNPIPMIVRELYY
jgi:hypothetical protein